MGINSKYFEAEDDEVLSNEILDFARQHHTKDFPNPKRENCPSSEDLLKIVNLGELPQPVLQEHLLNCSPCFLEFQSAREHTNLALAGVYKPENPTKKSPWYLLFISPVPAIVLFLFICGLTGSILYGLFARSDVEVSKQNESNFPSTDPIISNQHTLANSLSLQNENKPLVKLQFPSKQGNLLPNIETKNSKKSSQSKTKLLARNTVNLDLNKAAILRNESSEETVYNLRPENLTLNIKLPTDSPAGSYEISLLDEFGNTLLRKNTISRNGKSLNTNFNVQRKKGRARLCVALKGEIPDCFAIKIGN
jgi:hypothetical protein